MKRFSIVAMLGLVSAVGGLVGFAQGCGSDSEESSTKAAPGQPPPKPSGPVTTSTTEKNFAIREVLVGERARGSTTRDGDAWRKFGYNIDGKVSTSDVTDECKLVGAASKSVHRDGDDGIDNSFGANILPIVMNASATVPETMNKAITDGKFTLMLDLTGLSEEPAQTATGLKGAILAGGDLGKPPTFTKTDNWPVRPETLTDKSDPRSSSIRLDDAYVVSGKYVAQGDLRISLAFGATEITLDLKKAIVTFEHKGSNAENGMLAGVVRTEQLVEQLKKLAGNISPALCGDGIDGILQQIREASDIMADGTSGSPSAECNGISLGLGFSASEIALPQVVGPAAVPGPDQCADAGTD